MTKVSAPTIHDLYPNLNEQQLEEVEETFEQYLTLMLRVFERVEAEATIGGVN
jgi:hypothetical protein